jgi:signal peptidase I
VTSLFFLALCLSGCRVIGLQTYRVAGSSMEPLLREGDKILVSTSYYAHHPLRDDDVVVFRHDGKILIKRISGLPGETVEGRSGALYRNGQLISEPFVAAANRDQIPELANFPAQTVAKDEIFVTGDNRGRSLDSRLAAYGPVHTGDVVGRLMSKY